MFETFFRDLKQSLRMFVQNPAFSLAAVAALTLGIGANTAIFSVVNAVLLRPASFPDPDRVVVFMNTSPQGGMSPAASPAKFAHWRQQSAVVQDVAAFNTGVVNYTGGEFPGNRGKQEPIDLFCDGGSKLLGYNLATGDRGRVDPAAAFQLTLTAAEKGYVPAQAVVGMLYAVGKGVELNRITGSRWWAKAAEGGDPYAMEWRPPRPANAGSARPAAAPANSNNPNRD